MDLATQNHLAALRELLTYRLNELRAEVHAAQMEDRAREIPASEVRDRKDDASERSLNEVDAAEQQRDMDELELVEAALQRLDRGVYGDCVDCAQAIPLARLRVQPAAARCASCQAAFEARKAAQPS